MTQEGDGGLATDQQTASPPVAESRVPARLRAGAANAPKALLILLGLVILGWVAALVFMSTMPFTGDEEVYARNAGTIADVLLGRGGTWGEVAREVVAFGWFMPGASLLLVPLYVVDPEPGVALIRLYMSAIYLVLWIWALREVSAAFGRYGAIALLVFPSLTTMWLLFAQTVWGDLPAGLLLAIVAARAYRLGVRIFEDAPLGFREMLVLELAITAMVYLRGNTIIAAVGVHAVLLGLAVISRRWTRLLRTGLVLAAGGALFLVLLAPWSVTATRLLGGPVLTTSSAQLAIGITFGDVDVLCEGPCATDDDKPWKAAAKFSRREAKERDTSQLQIQREMSARALEGLTLPRYTAQVRSNFASFAGHPGGFIARFTNENGRDFESKAPIRDGLRLLTYILYWPFLAVLVLANLAVAMRSRRVQIISLLVKLLSLSLFLQPFLHPSHARYWVTFGPVMTLAAVMFLHWAGARGILSLPGGHAVASVEDTDSDAGDLILTILQAAYVAVFVAIAFVVLLV